jgi:putative tryptophan/tyrosine transport system substrate-binding protein
LGVLTRSLLCRCGGAALAYALAMIPLGGAFAESDKTRRLGIISQGLGTPDSSATKILALIAKEGFIEGRNLAVLNRYGPAERVHTMMREVLAARPDVILAIGGEPSHAATAATSSIPVVIFGPDPVAMGVADSIARPGRNVTGFVILPNELDAKRLQILHEALPGAQRLAALVHPRTLGRSASERDMRAVATGLRLDLRIFYAAEPQDYSAAFAAMRASGMGGAVIMANPEYYRDRGHIARLAAASRLPTICQWSEMAAEGCMLSYGPSIAEAQARVAYLVARILSGAKPAELPIEQPARVEFVVNLATARSLAISIPEHVLQRADKIIE